MSNIPKYEPDQFMAGDTIKWTKSLQDYKASEGWTLSYFFISVDGKFQIDAAADGDDFSVSVDPATSEDYDAGVYTWVAFVYKTDGKTPPTITERYQVGQGSCEVLEDLSQQLAGYDTRTHAEKVLEALDTLIEGKALRDDQQYSIAGRSILLMSIKDILFWKDYYLLAVKNEQDKDKVAKGESPGNKVLPRFGPYFGLNIWDSFFRNQY